MAVKAFTLQNIFYLDAAAELARLAVRGSKGRRKTGYVIPCVVGAVTASVAFLECSVNGLYSHAASRMGRKTNYRRLLVSVYHRKSHPQAEVKHLLCE